MFSDPLIPMTGKAVAGENAALVSALLTFKKKEERSVAAHQICKRISGITLVRGCSTGFWTTAF